MNRKLYNQLGRKSCKNCVRGELVIVKQGVCYLVPCQECEAGKIRQKLKEKYQHRLVEEDYPDGRMRAAGD